MNKGQYRIGRHQEGICLNPKEYILNDSGEIRRFDTIEKAINFLINKGISEEDCGAFSYELV